MSDFLWALNSGVCLCRFYFAYCEAAFDAKYIHNFQITWQKTSQVASDTPLRQTAETQPGSLPLSGGSDPADPFTQVRSPALHLLNQLFFPEQV